MKLEKWVSVKWEENRVLRMIDDKLVLQIIKAEERERDEEERFEAEEEVNAYGGAIRSTFIYVNYFIFPNIYLFIFLY